MPSLYALLLRQVLFVSGGSPVTGATSSEHVETSTGGASKEEAAAAVVVGSSEAAAAISGGPEEMPMETILEAMKLDPAVCDPPEITRITMVRQLEGGGVPPGVGIISSADKALVVLYAGHYRPGLCKLPSSGCYLVYDASTNSLSAVPQLPSSDRFTPLGRAAAILSHGKEEDGAYVLAEVVATTSGFPDGALYLWHCPSSNLQGRQWIRKAVRLPRQVFDPTYFIDTAFSYAGSSICWVDLLSGVLVCNLLKSPEQPEFTFVPLPQGHSIDVASRRWSRPRAQQFRTMGCVNGVIKFVAIVGYIENSDSKDLMLRSWTLSPDLKEWKAGNTLRVSDLWKSKSFRETDLPELAPSFPIISINEPDVVYVMMNDVSRVAATNAYGDVVGWNIVNKARYMLRINLAENKVLHCTKAISNDKTPFFPELVASEFPAYLHGSKGHQEGAGASMAGGS